MEDSSDLLKAYKKFLEPIIAISVVILLAWLLFSLIEENKLKGEIAENCGYETKKYVCYCEKKFVEDMKIQIENYNKPNGGFDFNVTLD